MSSGHWADWSVSGSRLLHRQEMKEPGMVAFLSCEKSPAGSSITASVRRPGQGWDMTASVSE